MSAVKEGIDKGTVAAARALEAENDIYFLADLIQAAEAGEATHLANRTATFFTRHRPRCRPRVPLMFS